VEKLVEKALLLLKGEPAGALRACLAMVSQPVFQFNLLI
jgi:hypothetical protein